MPGPVGTPLNMVQVVPVLYARVGSIWAQSAPSVVTIAPSSRDDRDATVHESLDGDGGAGVGVPADVPAAMPSCWEAVQFPATRHPLRPLGLVMPLLAATCCCCAMVQFPAVRHAADGGSDAPGWPAGTVVGDAVTVTVAAVLHAAAVPATMAISATAMTFMTVPPPLAARVRLSL
jgi:hypothetical protein